ncbi:MAG TPA: hypothetical protein VGF94_03835 [Kofleriaceae bacterium]
MTAVELDSMDARRNLEQLRNLVDRCVPVVGHAFVILSISPPLSSRTATVRLPRFSVSG